MVIGHEITHGFDNNGRHFGPFGGLQSWWTNDAATQFDQRASCLVNQYSSYPVYDQYVNGSQTEGENIADNGGIEVAFQTYKQYVSVNNITVQYMKEYSNDQLFFLYFAQNWCCSATPQGYLDMLLDVHSPPR